ncbi:glycosyltransferase family 2 protein [Xanthomarina sp. F2636L]|uniref:glycosyltransferase family 2 protein n=1 Tax=Xanthomarina sp. F2636L TaxID=2996018 RepID=UPI00225E4D76|nr:glycosyltransferase family 2 protein [Xanthomarina sp. F2636L]MCX7551337.1 glycosyltransferase family 2 protein [Xanthomarina sp. F2636L]
MDLSIIIVNYNGEEYLTDCLDSIEKQCQGFSYEIIIWDNASKDNSIEFLKNNYSNKIKLFASKDNLGFAGGNNAAAKHAQGKYFFLLNNDTILLNPMKPILDLMRKDSKIGVLGIKMLNGNKNYTISSGSLPKPYQLIYFKWFSIINKEFASGMFSNNNPIEVGWLSGSFLVTPKSLWEDIGGLDESFFMYVEDVDYNKEVAKRGYKRMFMPNLEYIHFVGFSGAKNNLLVKGYRIYIKKHFSGLNRLIANFCLSINELVKKAKKSY